MNHGVMVMMVVHRRRRGSMMAVMNGAGMRSGSGVRIFVLGEGRADKQHENEG